MSKIRNLIAAMFFLCLFFISFAINTSGASIPDGCIFTHPNYDCPRNFPENCYCDPVIVE